MAGRYGLYGAAVVLVVAQWLQAISVGFSLFRETDERKDLAISMVFTLSGVVLLGWASWLSLTGSRLSVVQAVLLLLAVLVIVRTIRRERGAK